jgi:hypothetical protein
MHRIFRDLALAGRAWGVFWLGVLSPMSAGSVSDRRAPAPRVRPMPGRVSFLDNWESATATATHEADDDGNDEGDDGAPTSLAEEPPTVQGGPRRESSHPAALSLHRKSSNNTFRKGTVELKISELANALEVTSL